MSEADRIVDREIDRLMDGGSIPIEQPEPTWTTKDGRVIPISKLGDRHLTNILRMIQRKCVIRAAAATALLAAASPRGDQAQLEVERELGRQLERSWRDEKPAIWEALMYEAKRRPLIADEAAEIEAADLGKEQLLVECRLVLGDQK